jgi:hypothetical protein
MRYYKLVALLALGLLLTACGSSNGSNTNSSINGNWTATLLDTNGKPVFNFTTALASSGSAGLVISNFKFTTSSPCFGASPTESGGFSLGGNFNGNVSGSLTMTIQSGSGASGNNLLSLQGTVHNNTVSGTWTLTGTGAGCTGSGNFSMNKG